MLRMCLFVMFCCLVETSRAVKRNHLIRRLRKKTRALLTLPRGAVPSSSTATQYQGLGAAPGAVCSMSVSKHLKKFN